MPYVQEVVRASEIRASARREALHEASDVAYDSWNGLNGHPGNPFDARTREGRAWSDGAARVMRAVAALERGDDPTAAHEGHVS